MTLCKINNIAAFLKSPKLREYKTIICLWCISGIIYAIVKFLISKYNNYKIFKYVFWHTIENMPLYKEYPDQYYDNNHYGIIFNAIIAPFAILPDLLGLIFWNVCNTIFLFYAIRQLPLTHNQKILIYWFSFIELMTAQGVQQFNISVAGIIILSFALIEKEKDFWAACIIVIGTLIKIYPIVGLAFFFFSKQKRIFVLSFILWGIIFFFLPILYTSGLDYVLLQYEEWFEILKAKNLKNMFAASQNISLLGFVRKLTGISSYDDLCLIIPGLILFLIPYTRIKQYKYLRFRLMILANVLLFVVLFSTGTEASGYIIAMIGVAVWYINSPSKCINYKYWLFISTLVIVGISTTEIVPRILRLEFIQPFVLKSWMCIIVWFTICYETIFLDFHKNESTLKSDKFTRWKMEDEKRNIK